MLLTLEPVTHLFSRFYFSFAVHLMDYRSLYISSRESIFRSDQKRKILKRPRSNRVNSQGSSLLIIQKPNIMTSAKPFGFLSNLPGEFVHIMMHWARSWSLFPNWVTRFAGHYPWGCANCYNFIWYIKSDKVFRSDRQTTVVAYPRSHLTKAPIYD